MNKRDSPAQVGMKPPRVTTTSVTVPVAEEQVTVKIRRSERSRVRVTKTVEEEPQIIRREAVSRTVVVERVAMNRFVEQPGGARLEGDTLVIPVHEEVPVVVMRTKLKEEIRITTRTTSEERRIPVTVRRERVMVERRAERPSADQRTRRSA